MKTQRNLRNTGRIDRGRRRGSGCRILAALLLFGAAFGFVEAAVVVDLRALYEPIHQRLHPEAASDDLFPVIRLDQVEAEGPGPRRWLAVEVAREAATLVMLVGVGMAVGGRFPRGFAAFLVAFGAWDIAFYAWLKVILGWPSSCWTWDLLFLLPVPWSGPVLAPLLVAATMTGAGAFVLWREDGDRPLRIERRDWSVAGLGGLIVAVAFCWDSRTVLAGGRPGPFPWWLFALGMGLGLSAFMIVVLGTGTARPEEMEVPGHSETMAIRPQ